MIKTYGLPPNTISAADVLSHTSVDRGVISNCTGKSAMTLCRNAQRFDKMPDGLAIGGSST